MSAMRKGAHNSINREPVTLRIAAGNLLTGRTPARFLGREGIGLAKPFSKPNYEYNAFTECTSKP